MPRVVSSKRRRIVVAAAVVLVATALVSLASSRETPRAAEEERATAGRAVTSEARIYALSFASHDTAEIGGGERHGGELSLEGELSIQTLSGNAGGVTREAWRIARLDRCEMRFDGASPLGTLDDARTAFEEAVLVVERAADGAIAAVETSDGALTGRVLELLALELSVPAESGAHRTSHGVARARVSGDAAERSVVWDAYELLDAAQDASGDARVRGEQRARFEDGAVSTLEGHESIAWRAADEMRGLLVSTRYSLALARREPARGLSLAALVRRAPLEVDSDAQRQRLLEAQAEGMTAEELESQIATHGLGGQVPDHSRFLYRSVAFLQLHPEAADGLVSIFLDSSSTTPLRELVLDLLAQAGCEEAVLRLVRSPVVQGSEDEVNLLQRAGLLDAPGPALAAHLEARLAATDPDVQHAAAYTLGTVAARLGREHAAEASQARQTLAARIDAARDAESRAHCIVALGAASADEDVDTLAAHAADDADQVRHAVARALGRTRTRRGRERLLELSADSSVAVQREAIASLRGYALDRDALGTLADALREGRVAPESFFETHQLLRERALDEPAAVADALRAMEQRGIADASERVRALGLLHDLEQRTM